MAISKRIRYEVMKRDSHTCRYCRSTENPLTIDHVIPIALGGSDKPDNLVAACRDCNAGKSSTHPDDDLIEQVSDDAIRWAEARKQAIEMHMIERRAQKKYVHEFWQHWDDVGWAENLPNDWEGSVSRWHKEGVPFEILKDAATIAWCANGVPDYARFRYMAGVLRNKLAEIDAKTDEILKGNDNGA